jgi:hypothetical protein
MELRKRGVMDKSGINGDVINHVRKNCGIEKERGNG